MGPAGAQVERHRLGARDVDPGGRVGQHLLVGLDVLVEGDVAPVRHAQVVVHAPGQGLARNRSREGLGRIERLGAGPVGLVQAGAPRVVEGAHVLPAQQHPLPLQERHGPLRVAFALVHACEERARVGTHQGVEAAVPRGPLEPPAQQRRGDLAREPLEGPEQGEQRRGIATPRASQAALAGVELTAPTPDLPAARVERPRGPKGVAVWPPLGGCSRPRRPAQAERQHQTRQRRDPGTERAPGPAREGRRARGLPCAAPVLRAAVHRPHDGTIAPAMP